MSTGHQSEGVTLSASRRRGAGRAAAEARWLGARAGQAVRRRLVVPRTATPTRTPDRYPRVRLERDVRVPMRDGVALSAHVFHPAGVTEPLPAVLIRQPYGKDDHPYLHARGVYWARKGYVCVVQDVRGKYASQGRWEPVVREADDGWDTLDWVAGQPWCNGDIGMAGESYYGLTQWAVAGAGHPNLRCVTPGDTFPDLYRAVYPGGAFALMTMGEWAYEMDARRLRNRFRFDPWRLPLAGAFGPGAPSPTFSEFVGHPRRDDFWRQRDFTDTRFAVPALHWSGWYDVMLDGSLAGWRAAASRHGGAAGAEVQQLVIAPTDHGLTPTRSGLVGRIAVERHSWSFDRVQRFFERWLRGVHNGVERDPAVRVYVVGAGRWRSGATWPLPDTELVRYYLHARAVAGAREGVLTREVPTDEPVDRFSYDPDAPVTYWLGRSLWDLAGELDDRRPLEARPDVLVYSTPTLAAGLEIVGPLTATLYVSSSAPGTDFTAALVDVFPDGYAQLVQEGIVRLSSADGDDRAASDADGVARAVDHTVRGDTDLVREVVVDLCATGHLFAAGHRLRLEVSSSNFARFDRNPNTGCAPGADERRAVARQTVYHDRRHPSHLTLPLPPREADDDATAFGKRHS